MIISNLVFTERLLFAFASILSPFFMGWAIVNYAKTRAYVTPTMYRRQFLVLVGMMTWMIVAVAAAFNGAIYNVAPQTPLSVLFRYLLLLVVPLLVGVKALMYWRDVLHDLKMRFKQ